MTALRQKRQQDDDGDGDDEPQSVDELCKDRPPDEYFRLSTTGDCRDVVRSALADKYSTLAD